ncbi:HAD hydrolase-like protein [Streptomyces sp. NPDC012450]|uniref:HAD hydrolase-like protein n=1 Tax=Streptomyces sp. NPDC012450 TaxID=3364834 RepID=UPI0036E5D886
MDGPAVHIFASALFVEPVAARGFQGRVEGRPWGPSARRDRAAGIRKTSGRRAAVRPDGPGRTRPGSAPSGDTGQGTARRRNTNRRGGEPRTGRSSLRPRHLPRMVELVPQRLAAHTEDLREHGVLMPGAIEALRSVHVRPDCVPTIVTGNLKPNALLELAAFDLGGFVDTEIGGYASDDQYRPALVGVAQKRAQAKHRAIFTHANTVIIGDSLEDVRTGLEGGAAVVAVGSGKTPVTTLREAGADVVLGTLENVQELHDAIVSVVQLRL